MTGKNLQKNASTGKKAKNPHQLELRRMCINELYLKGKQQTEIAEIIFSRFGVKVSQQTISNDLKAIREEWKKHSAMLIDDRLSLELAKIDQLERDYHAMFEKSKGLKGKKLGELKYKQRVEWCIDRRCVLLGVDAPKRTEISGPQGIPIKLDDVRQRFANRIAAIVQRREAGKNLT